MKKFLLLSLIFISVFSCNESESPTPIEAKTTYTVESSSTQPGFLLTIKASKHVTKDTCTVHLAGEAILLTKIDSFQYVFFVPVLSPGKYMLDLKHLDSGNNPEVVIRDYAVITDPNEVIASVITKYNGLADSLVKNSLDNAVSTTDAGFMHQLMDQLKQTIEQCSSDEKLLLAYQLQNMSLDASFAEAADLDKTYLASGRVNLTEEDPSTTIIYKAFEGTRAHLKAIAAATALAITFTVLATNPITHFTIGVTVISLASFVYITNGATKIAADTKHITAMVENDATEVNGNGTSANPIVVSVGRTFLESFQAKFRTLRKSDAVDELNVAITEFIKVTYDLAAKDGAIKDKFNNIKTTLSSYFDKITISHSPYVSPILESAEEKIAPIKSKFISVTNVSNPDITIAVSSEGSNGLKLTFDNPSNNIKTVTDFTFQLTYAQKEINKQATITQHGKFYPASYPKVTTTVVGSITATTASSGGIITNDGGSEIIAKGVCWSTSPNPTIANSKTDEGPGNGSFVSKITGLAANSTYYVKAYAIHNSGTAYGDTSRFTTPPVEPLVLISPADNAVFSGGAITGGVKVTFTWSGKADYITLWIPGPGPREIPVTGNEFSINLGSSPDRYWRVGRYNGPPSETRRFVILP